MWLSMSLWVGVLVNLSSVVGTTVAPAIFDTLLALAPADPEYLRTGLVVQIGDAFVVNLPEFLLPVCGDYLNHRQLRSLERRCSDRVVALIDRWLPNLPHREPYESVEQYSRVHELETSLHETRRFSTHRLWLDIRDSIDRDVDDNDMLDLLLDFPSGETSPGRSVFFQYAQSVAVDFPVRYLPMRNLVWNREGEALVHSADLDLTLLWTRLPPKLAIVTVFGLVSHLFPDEPSEAADVQDLQPFFHAAELARVSPDCRLALRAGHVSEPHCGGNPSPLEGGDAHSVEADSILVGLTRVAHGGVGPALAGALHRLALRVWREQEDLLSDADLPQLLRLLVGDEAVKRLPEACGSWTTSEACRAELVRIIQAGVTPRLRTQCVLRELADEELRACVLAGILGRATTGLVEEWQVVSSIVEADEPRKRKREKALDVAAVVEAGGSVVEETLKHMQTVMDPNFQTSELAVWLQALFNSPEFLFIKPWSKLALFRLLGRVFGLLSTLSPAERAALSTPFFSVDFLGAALTSEEAWAVSVRRGLELGGRNFSLAQLVQVCHGLSGLAEGEWLYSGVKIPQYAAQGGQPKHAVRNWWPFILVRRDQRFTLLDSLVQTAVQTAVQAAAGGGGEGGAGRDGPVAVQYADEPGVGRGVLLEWLGEMGLAIFGEYGLFVRTKRGELELNTAGIRHHENPQLVQEYLKFAGRVVRMALRTGEHVSLGLALGPVLAKTLVGEAVVAGDLGSVDPQLDGNLDTLRDMTREQVAELVDEETWVGTQVTVAEPLIYGQQARDTVQGVEDVDGYIAALKLYRLGVIGKGAQFDFYGSLTAGFGATLTGETGEFVQRQMLGVQEFDVRAWRRRTRVAGHAGRRDAVTATVNLFFRCLEKLHNPDRRRVFSYWTGLVALPPRGFPDLPMLTILGGSHAVKAATCFSQLNLPDVTDEADMDALLLALIPSGVFTHN